MLNLYRIALKTSTTQKKQKITYPQLTIKNQNQSDMHKKKRIL